MVKNFKLAEKVLVVVGILYLTESFNNILPGAILSPLQYGIYGSVFCLLLARWRRTFQTIIQAPFLWLLLSLALLSFLWSDFPNNSLINSIVAWQTSFFAVYLASCYGLKQQLKLIGCALGIAMVFSLLYSLAFPSIAIYSDGVHQGDWKAIYTHKNTLAQISTLSSLVFVFLTLTIRRYRAVAFAVLLSSIILLERSGSVTALLVFTSLIILLQLYKALRWKNPKLVMILIIIIIIFSSLTVLLISQAELVLNTFGRELTLTGRTDIWAGTISYIQERPWLGYGRNAFWNPQSYHAVEIGEQVAANYTPPHSHNGFIDLTCDLGLLGLTSFLLSFLLSIKKAYTNLKITSSLEDIWPIMYLSFFFLYNLTESSIMKHNSALWAIYMTVALSF